MNTLNLPLRAEQIATTISRLSTNYGRLMGLATGFKWELERNPDAEDRERRIQAIQQIIDECAADDQIKETADLIVRMSEELEHLRKVRGIVWADANYINLEWCKEHHEQLAKVVENLRKWSNPDKAALAAGGEKQ